MQCEKSKETPDLQMRDYIKTLHCASFIFILRKRKHLNAVSIAQFSSKCSNYFPDRHRARSVKLHRPPVVCDSVSIDQYPAIFAVAVPAVPAE